MSDKKERDWLIIALCIITVALAVLVCALGLTDMYQCSGISEQTNYVHTGEIINVQFVEYSIVRPATIVQFKNNKYLEFHDERLYEIHESSNAIIYYSVNKYDRMFFNSITYEN
jgi:hypothetical protein